MANLETLIKEHFLEATKRVEEHVDAELEKLDNLDSDDIRHIREKRLKELKKRESDKQEWLAMGHGQYSEVFEEKAVFDFMKKSKNFVLVFYKRDSQLCVRLDQHMEILAKDHVETRFAKINVEKAPFLTERLKIRIIPTIVLVKDAKVEDFIVGFTELGNCEDFSTEMLEWRIARSQVIEYQGDIRVPPEIQKISQKKRYHEKKKTIRCSNIDDDLDDDFLND